jgi:hypothetical protein
LEESLTISEFCKLEKISKATYYAMQHKGTGPVETRHTNPDIIRISPQARSDWHERLQSLSDAPEAQNNKARLSARGRKAVAARKRVTT